MKYLSFCKENLGNDGFLWCRDRKSFDNSAEWIEVDDYIADFLINAFGVKHNTVEGVWIIRCQ